MLIHGDDDRTTPLEPVEQIAASIPGAGLVVLPGAGHRPDVRNPELVNPLIAEFLGIDAGPG